MPLLVMCGIPGSGKSHRATAIAQFFRDMGKEVVVFSEETLGMKRAEQYKDSTAEKHTRGRLKSSVERTVQGETIVICDSMNYIKGFRYELHCLARISQTTQLNFFCDTPPAQAAEWNKMREDSFSDQLFTELCFRFEPPNPANRWDKPMIAVRPDEETPFEAVREALLEGKVPAPTLATIPQRLSDTNFLYELEQATKEIMQAIIDAQIAGALPGDSLAVPRTKSKIVMPARISLVELRKMRQQFVRITELSPPPVEKLGDLFTAFLNSNLPK